MPAGIALALEGPLLENHDDASQFAALLRSQPLPLAFVDLAAFDQNLARLLLPAGVHGKKVRLATKSLRCPAEA